MKTHYWLQTQTPAGNWVDSLGSADRVACIRHGRYLQGQGQTVRVVERADSVVWDGTWGGSLLDAGAL